MCSHQAKLFHSAHTATARQLTSWLSSLAMVSGLHFALATTWRWSLRLLALFAWLRSARKAASEYLRGIAWVGSTYALGERLHTIQKSERHGGRRFTDRFAREHDSEFGPQIARRKVLPPRVGGARRRVLDLRGAKEELLRATERCAFNQVCRLTDIVRQLAKSSCPSPRLEFSTFSVPCEPFLPCLKLSQEWQAKHNENYRKSPSSKFEVWCKTFLANDQISSCFSSRRG